MVLVCLCIPLLVGYSPRRVEISTKAKDESDHSRLNIFVLSILFVADKIISWIIIPTLFGPTGALFLRSLLMGGGAALRPFWVFDCWRRDRGSGLH